jgi:Flp pilus assembly protein TadG
MRGLRSIRSFLREDKAAVTIEFVLMLPMFLIALAISFEFGQIFLAHQQTVDNVRQAARYLSHTDLSGSDIARALNIVRTGRVAGGAAPDFLSASHADVTITPNYKSFGPPDYSRSGNTSRIRVRVSYPLTIFTFIDNRASIPFVVVEDLRYVGV